MRTLAIPTGIPGPCNKFPYNWTHERVPAAEAIPGAAVKVKWLRHGNSKLAILALRILTFRRGFLRLERLFISSVGSATARPFARCRAGFRRGCPPIRCDSHRIRLSMHHYPVVMLWFKSRRFHGFGMCVPR